VLLIKAHYIFVLRCGLHNSPHTAPCTPPVLHVPLPATQLPVITQHAQHQSGVGYTACARVRLAVRTIRCRKLWTATHLYRTKNMKYAQKFGRETTCKGLHRTATMSRYFHLSTFRGLGVDAAGLVPCPASGLDIGIFGTLDSATGMPATLQRVQ
jgi:hypothetical protein